MFRRILTYLLFTCLIIAFFIYFNTGLTHIEFGTQYSDFIRLLTYNFASVQNWRIPDIPEIEFPSLSELDWYEYLYIGLLYIASFLSTVGNLVVYLFNLGLSVLKFVYSIFKTFLQLGGVINNEFYFGSTTELLI